MTFSESIRIPPPYTPPKCNPSLSTKYKCIDNSCDCGWCLQESTKKHHDLIGHCFVYSNNIEKKCGSAAIHTHANSKMCHAKNIMIISLFSIWFAAFIITCIVICIICCVRMFGLQSSFTRQFV